MYPAVQAKKKPDKPAFIMASTGEVVTYGELEARTNRLAHLFRANGLNRLDHYSTFMENNNRVHESSGAGERSGLYFTCINSYLTADEVAYIINNRYLIDLFGCTEIDDLFFSIIHTHYCGLIKIYRFYCVI